MVAAIDVLVAIVVVVAGVAVLAGLAVLDGVVVVARVPVVGQAVMLHCLSSMVVPLQVCTFFTTLYHVLFLD